MSNSVRQDFFVNAEQTSDWRHPVYEAVSQSSVSREAGVSQMLGGCKAEGERTEGRQEEKEKKENKHTSSPAETTGANHPAVPPENIATMLCKLWDGTDEAAASPSPSQESSHAQRVSPTAVWDGTLYELEIAPE